MFAVRVSPARPAPPLQVEEGTAEKNTSPSVSVSEGSPHPGTWSDAVHSQSSVTPKRGGVVAPSRFTFARTNLASDRASTQTVHPRDLSPAAVRSGSVDSAVPPSPVRSILDFYLGASPSPRRPQFSSAKSTDAHRDTQPAEQEREYQDSISSRSSSRDFKRSPAPARSYLDDFLAASDSTIERVNRAAMTPLTPAQAGTHAQSSRSPGSYRVVGVAMDNSPVVPQMWEETSSSSSSSVLSSSLLSSGSLPPSVPATSALSMPHYATETAQAAESTYAEPLVERELLYPVHKTERDSISDSSDTSSHPASSQRTRTPPFGSGVRGIASTVRFVESPRLAVQPVSDGNERETLPSSTALSSLLTLHRGVGSQPSRATVQSATLAGAQQPPQRATVKTEWRESASVPPVLLLRSGSDARAQPAAAAGQLTETAARHATPAFSGTRHCDPHHDNTDGAAQASMSQPSRGRSRSVVARLYPAKEVAQRASRIQSARDDRPDHLPRWNASTKLTRSSRTGSIEETTELSGMTQRRGRSASEDYVKERPQMSARPRSCSLPPPKPTAPTRTTLLRLAALSARQAAQAAEREEEEHPSFHPQVAPQSVRICRAKLRQLAQNVHAAEDANQQALSGPAAAAAGVAAEALSRAGTSRRSAASDSKEKSHPQHLLTQRQVQPKGVTERLYSDAAQLRLRREQRWEESRQKESAMRHPVDREEGYYPSKQRAAPKQTSRSVESAVVSHARHCSTESSAQQLESASMKGKHAIASSTASARQDSAETVPVSPPSSLSSPQPLLRRVDLYDSAEVGATSDVREQARLRRQTIEERLLALEEERRRRLGFLQQLSSGRRESSGRHLLQPFTGR